MTLNDEDFADCQKEICDFKKSLGNANMSSSNACGDIEGSSARRGDRDDHHAGSGKPNNASLVFITSKTTKGNYFGNRSDKNLVVSYPGSTPEAITGLVRHYGRTGEFLRNCFIDSEMTDVKLVADDSSAIQAHRVVLAAHSEHLKDVFIKKPATKTVQIESTSGKTLLSLVEYMYSGEVAIDLNDISDILNAARLLKITEIERMCEAMLSRPKPETALVIMDIAAQFALPHVHKLAYNQLTKHFMEVVSTEAFLKLDLDDFCKILSDDNIEVKTEMDIFRTALRWLNHDKPVRTQPKSAARAMSCVRFPLMSTQELLECNEEAGELAKQDEIQNMLYYANWYHTCITLGKSSKVNFKIPPSRSKSPIKSTEKYREYSRIHDSRTPNAINSGRDSHRPINASKNASARDSPSPTPSECGDNRNFSRQQALDYSTFTQATFVCTGGFNMQCGDKKLPMKQVEIFHPKYNDWLTLASLPERRTHHASICLDGAIYVTGGFNGRSVVNAVFKYDLRDRLWREVAPMREKRMCHQICLLNKTIFVVGGQDENQELLASIECYDPENNVWIRHTEMAHGKLGCCVATHRNKLWVIGGYDDVGLANQANPVLRGVECYDPEKRKWTKQKSLTSGRCMAALAECAGQLYLLGGAAKSQKGSEPLVVSLASCLVYDDTKDEWREIGQLTEPRYNAGCAVVNGRIYIAGGMNSVDNKSLNSVECLDVKKGAWIRGVKDLPKLSLGLSCAAIPALYNI